MVKISVVGSASMDLVVTSPKRPKAGETVIGHSFSTVPGGKGANQAVAAARLGAEVSFVSCIGDDDYGQRIRENFWENGVSTTYVETAVNAHSGTAHIILAEEDNSIIVVKGANDLVSPKLIKKAEDVLKQADLVLIQQEIPEETVEYVVEFCFNNHIDVLLNPAPARKLNSNIISKVTYLTPNESEFELLFGGQRKSEVLKQYANRLIVTEGKNGVRFHNSLEEVVIPSYQVEMIDTTGAGDTFNAAFAVAKAEGKSLVDSLQFANCAASLSITKFGAQGGMPNRDDVDRILKSN
ncbi:ribokinase [Terrilactibacillus sp. BCM23-1]|uniref:Ribokinase n=1 Tax=Terrilactibacillus tamarindi TaxID=2599694 RepID=A0A6N8CUM7_9BACI|nr:ribokinase [Terrilactibacillus tamarindi]MTT32805.1 ribokinase [Terrilactibacillus tamarindi]